MPVSKLGPVDLEVPGERACPYGWRRFDLQRGTVVKKVEGREACLKAMHAAVERGCVAGLLYCACPGGWLRALEEDVSAAGGTVIIWKRGAPRRCGGFRWAERLEEDNEADEFSSVADDRLRGMLTGQQEETKNEAEDEGRFLQDREDGLMQRA